MNVLRVKKINITCLCLGTNKNAFVACMANKVFETEINGVIVILKYIGCLVVFYTSANLIQITQFSHTLYGYIA